MENVQTVPTLGVVPVLYALLFRVRYRGFVYEEVRQA